MASSSRASSSSSRFCRARSSVSPSRRRAGGGSPTRQLEFDAIADEHAVATDSSPFVFRSEFAQLQSDVEVLSQGGGFENSERNFMTRDSRLGEEVKEIMSTNKIEMIALHKKIEELSTNITNLATEGVARERMLLQQATDTAHKETVTSAIAKAMEGVKATMACDGEAREDQNAVENAARDARDSELSERMIRATEEATAKSEVNAAIFEAKSQHLDAMAAEKAKMRKELQRCRDMHVAELNRVKAEHARSIALHEDKTTGSPLLSSPLLTSPHLTSPHLTSPLTPQNYKILGPRLRHIEPRFAMSASPMLKRSKL